MNNLETYLKTTRDKNSSFVNLLITIKDIENNSAIKL